MRKKMWFKIKRICKIPYHCYMCIRYPFLYPRNRFTGLHYNNWKVLEFASDIYKKYCNTKFSKDEMLSELEIAGFESLYPYYVERPSKCMITGWVNWWSKPLWKLVNFYHKYILQFFHCIPTWNEWEAVEKGWNKAFGKQYLNDLKKQLKKDKMLYSWRIMDIKEKYGTFRLYCNYGSDELYRIIDKYENLSWNTCIKCGKPATHISRGWICPYCEDCAKDVGGYGCVKRGTEEEKELGY